MGASHSDQRPGAGDSRKFTVLGGELGVLPARAWEGLLCVHRSCEGFTPQAGHLAFLAGRGIS